MKDKNLIAAIGACLGVSIASSIMFAAQPDAPQAEPVDPIDFWFQQEELERKPRIFLYESPWATCGSDAECERIGDELSPEELERRRRALRMMLR